MIRAAITYLNLCYFAKDPPDPHRLFQAAVAAAGNFTSPDVERGLRALEAASYEGVWWASNIEQPTEVLTNFRYNHEKSADVKFGITRQRHLDAGEHVVFYIRTDDDTAATKALEKIFALGCSEDLIRMEVRAVRGIEPEDESAVLKPTPDGEFVLRVPLVGTRDQLREAYRQRQPPDDVHVKSQPYSRLGCVTPYRVACFKIIGDAGEPLAWPREHGYQLAAMLRHAVAKALGRVVDSGYLLGHVGYGHNRLHPFYVPLPTNTPYDNRIRRVAIMEPAGGLGIVVRFKGRRELASLDLISTHGERVGTAEASQEEFVFRDYLKASSKWTTVTPVVLDRKGGRQRVEKRLSALLVRMGYPKPRVLKVTPAFCNIEMLPVKVREQARMFAQAEVEFPARVSGPVLAGRGVGYGIGLFANNL